MYGDGVQTTQLFEHSNGLHRVELINQWDSNFIVALLGETASEQGRPQ
jgi:hypothetical protein